MTKKVIIIGAGIVGLTSACRLAQEGFQVTIIEKNSRPGTGTSQANAGQLIYNFGAMASPSFIKNLPKALTDPNQGIIAGKLLLPSNWLWALKFLSQSTSNAWQKNSLALINIAHRSRSAMKAFNRRHDIDFNWRKDGKLIIYDNEASLRSAETTAKFQREHGGNHQVISKEKCFELEPALINSARKISGATYLADAEIGDCYAYCKSLADILCRHYGGKIHYNVTVDGFESHKDQISAVKTTNGLIEGDIFIISAGIDSPKLLDRSFPNKSPIIGIKGISLTYPLGSTPPDLSVTDAAGKFVIARLGEKVRVTGYAIFSSDLSINPDHVSKLEEKAKSLMPDAADYAASPDIWTGLRPQTPSDLPMISKAGAKNLYVNAGRGSSGWILSFGSAEKLTDIIINDNK
ncbi:MAG: FAD-dependent oxidoreductase [Emcibacteraceae bacterium]|nr:FAD-dependent oxidoreductase [Emcibacteraceae bacterium]